jgi:eukaryotic-like serine/threonine-protein kinase
MSCATSPFVRDAVIAVSAALAAAPVSSAGLASPTTRWSFQTEGPVRGAAVVSGDRVYFGSSDGRLYAVDDTDGSLVWSFDTGGAVAGAPAVAGSLVIVAGRGERVFAVDAATGAPRWSFAMQPDVPAQRAWDYFTASPVVDGNRVLVGSGDGHLYALLVETGELLWTFQTADSIRAAPLVAGDTVYQPSGDDYVYALAASDGSLLWKYATEGTTLDRGLGFMRSDIFTRPSLRDGLLVFGSRDSNVYAVDVATHEKRWSFSYDSTWAMSTAVDADTVYVGWSTNDMVCALDLATGAKKWEHRAGAHTYTTALVLGNDVYWGSADGHVYSFARSSGELNWSYEVGSEVYSSLVHDEGTLYFGADDGRLYALAEAPGPAHKAVYLPGSVPESMAFLVVDSRLAPYLVDSGFERLDSPEALAGFVGDRVADAEPSVVVFALAMIPRGVVGEDPGSGPLRSYLEAGGKVVWPWGAPNLNTFDDAGGYVGRDLGIPSRLLELEFVPLEDSGNYYSRATQAGRNWGFPAWLKTTFASLAPGSDVTPLATDEYGRVSAWLRSFHPRPGAGWVSLRTSGFGVPMSDPELALIERVASYALE